MRRTSLLLLIAATALAAVATRTIPARAVVPNEPPCPSCAVRVWPGQLESRFAIEGPAGATYTMPRLRCALADGSVQTLSLGTTGAVYRAGVAYAIPARAPAARLVGATLELRSDVGPLRYPMPITAR
ncbi:MAG: hypothetical protein JNK64_30895 [Myxococcales bacterium]|nr:hypothetical protein [Myxococcales bacterium]